MIISSLDLNLAFQLVFAPMFLNELLTILAFQLVFAPMFLNELLTITGMVGLGWVGSGFGFVQLADSATNLYYLITL